MTSSAHRHTETRHRQKWGARAVVGTVAAIVALASVPTPAVAQGLGGEWTEVWSSQRVSVDSWGEHCGARPQSRGRRAIGKSVTVTEAGGVLSVTGASEGRLASNVCKYTSMAKRVSYGPYVLTCSTPAGSSPMETGTYKFTSGDGGNTLRYKAKITQFLKLKGDTCRATLTYERLFQRKVPEAVAQAPEEGDDAQEGAAEEPEEVVEDDSKAKRTAARPKKADAQESEPGLLIPVTEDDSTGPAGGSANPVVSTRKAKKASSSALGEGWLLVAALVIVFGILLVVAAMLLLRGRKKVPEQTFERRTANAGRADKVKRSLYQKSAAKTTMMTAASVQAAQRAIEAGDPVGLATERAQQSSSVVVAGGTDRLDTTISVRVCPRCERRYDIAATFCPHDGSTLDAAEDRLPLADGASMLVCSECGKEQSGGLYCAEDGARLVVKDPQGERMVAIPVVICPTCQREYVSDEKICPNDGAKLLPIVGRRTGGMPMTGVGPKSKICSECGTRYSEEATFCGKDGSSLVNVN